MLKFSEFFEFSKEKFRKIPILKEFEWFEWFEWFGHSPIEPFNPGGNGRRGLARDPLRARPARRLGRGSLSVPLVAQESELHGGELEKVRDLVLREQLRGEGIHVGDNVAGPRPVLLGRIDLHKHNDPFQTSRRNKST